MKFVLLYNNYYDVVDGRGVFKHWSHLNFKISSGLRFGISNLFKPPLIYLLLILFDSAVKLLYQ